MAIQRIRAASTAGTTGGGGSIDVSFGALPAAGNMVAVLVWAYQSSIAFATNGVSDNQGNTYTRAAVRVQSGSGAVACAIYYCLSIGSPSGTFTVSIAGGGTGSLYASAAIMEFSGVGGLEGVAVIDETGASVNPATVTRSVSAASGLALAVLTEIVTQASITVEALSPTWTEEVEQLSYATYVPGEGNSRITTIGTGNYTANWTNATACAYAAALAVFTAAAGASGQFARPSSDVADGNWLNQASSNTNLYQSIDEAVADLSDADFIKSGAAPTDDTCTVGLSPITTPQAGTVTMRIRAAWL